jgi:hypothetical protein
MNPQQLDSPASRNPQYVALTHPFSWIERVRAFFLSNIIGSANYNSYYQACIIEEARVLFL